MTIIKSLLLLLLLLLLLSIVLLLLIVIFYYYYLYITHYILTLTPRGSSTFGFLLDAVFSMSPPPPPEDSFLLCENVSWSSLSFSLCKLFCLQSSAVEMIRLQNCREV